MARKFKPVTLVRGDRTIVADTAARETELRFEGYRSAPKEASETEAPEETPETETSKPAETPAQTAPKPGAKPAPKN